MRFTAGDLRGAVVDPAAVTRRLLASATGPQVATPRSPQRSWIEASLRRYCNARRNPDVLIGDYRTRTTGKDATPGKRSEIANGENMLELFLTWDEAEPTARICMQPRTDQRVVGHTISIAHDFVYERADGYLVRELWTDGVVRRPEHRRLLEAVSLLHAEQLFGVGRVREVQIWQLRLGLQEQITRSQAYALKPAIKVLLDGIQREVEGEQT